MVKTLKGDEGGHLVFITRRQAGPEESSETFKDDKEKNFSSSSDTPAVHVVFSLRICCSLNKLSLIDCPETDGDTGGGLSRTHF